MYRDDLICVESDGIIASVPKTLPMLLDAQPICCPCLEDPVGLSHEEATALAVRH